jgi:trk system potassium uptake protein TrkH
MLPPLLVDLHDNNPDWIAFLAAGGGTVFCGGLLVLANRRAAVELDIKSAFLLTTLSWMTVALFAALPLHLSTYRLSVTDALFEAMSGITTTGSTVIVGLDAAPRGLLLWRATLQALGGVGIIVMAILLLPFLRVGGMQLFRTEFTDRSAKPFPQTAALVGRIIAIYVTLLLLCALALSAAGLDGFDAITHAFTAVSTGGFSTRDASVGGFANPAAEWIIVVFMVIGGLPFLRMAMLLQGRPGAFLGDSQIRVFLLLVTLVVAVLALWLVVGQGRPLAAALRAAAFNGIAVITGTGYGSEDYTAWGEPVVAMMLAVMIIGGCTGSTTGGIKIFRLEILWTATVMYITGLFLPSRVARPRYAGRPIDNEIIVAVLSFVFLFIGAWGVFSVFLGALGLDLVTAISAAATALANVGPGLGHIVGPAGNFKPLPDAAKWLLTLAMLLGRLEFFTVLVLFHPAFWRR